MQVVIRRPAAEQLSKGQLREWQKFRGYSIRILEDLEHSGGKPTRDISTAAGIPCKRVTNDCCRMLKYGLVERVERWGWRITRNGIFLLSLSLNTTIAQQQHNNSTTTTQQEFKEPAPSCFHAKSCHIRQNCQDKRYTLKNRTLCQHCIWDSPGTWITPRAPVEMKVMG